MFTDVVVNKQVVANKVANSVHKPVANKVGNSPAESLASYGRYKDVEKRRTYMRDLMRRKRAKESG